VVAYPFSARDRGHRVLIERLHEVEAMCAIDALGIAPMLELPIEIRSRDPISGGEIHVQLHPQGAARWQPEGAVVLAGSTSCDGPTFGGCCDVLNFFEATETRSTTCANTPRSTARQLRSPKRHKHDVSSSATWLRED